MKECRENRELSWLKFNDRVLLQAKDNRVPLAEKLSFISIYQTNLDEFFRVRLGSLYDQALYFPDVRENKTDLTSEEQIKLCIRKIKALNRKKDRVYEKVMDELREYGVTLLKYHEVKNKTDRKYLDTFFERTILPLISPQIISKRQPFPFLNNGELYLAARLETRKGKRKLGLVSVSVSADKRLIRLPESSGVFILAEDLIQAKLPEIFTRQKVISSSVIRISRSAEIDEDDYSIHDHQDYREMMESLIKMRRRLAPLRLELSEGLDELEIDMLRKFLDLEKNQIFFSQSPLTFGFFGDIRDYLKIVHPELFYKPLIAKNSPLVENRVPMIKQIQKRDIFLAYPFESMSPFLRLLEEASNDPSVASIKMTLYRVSRDSRVVKSLIAAADNGKEVDVLVELRARFDEENNISWSKALEAAGCHVIYGLNGLKVHSKLCLITYKDGEEVKYITQIGTGNYNEKTARLYTDLCLMTSNREIGEDANNVFNHLSLGETVEETKRLFVAPDCMISKIFELMDEQIALAKEGKEAYVGFKCNSVTSKKMIEKLIEASQAGVKIDMVVRGICCIIPGIEGMTENINVISIVGRYLEHSRIYIFGAKDPKVYISSADLMTRNLARRVEVAAPIDDEGIKKMILNMFKCMLNDNVKACKLMPDGNYKRIKNKKEKMNCQEYFFKKNI